LPAIAAGESAEIIIPISEGCNPSLGFDLLLEIQIRLAARATWGSYGHKVAWSQFVLKPAVPVVKPVTSASRLTIVDEPNRLLIAGERFRFRFDKVHGMLAQIEHNGKPMLKSGPRLEVWRAPIDNDSDRHKWRELGLDKLTHRLDEFDVSEEGGAVVVRIDTRLAVTVKPQGEWGESIPRVGVRLSLLETFRRVKYYGLGRGESYPDSKQASRLGLWSIPVDMFETKYIFPQENGNRSEVRWVEFYSWSREGVRISSPDLFNFGVHRYTPEECDAAKHQHELKRRDGIVVNLDHRQHGLGTASCGPGPLPQYILKPEPWEFSFNFEPFTGSADAQSA